MKNTLILFSLIVGLCMVSCRANHDKDFYFNYKCRVVAINSNDIGFVGKFNSPTTCNVLLVQSLFDTTLYAKLSSCNSGNWYINLSDSNIYSKHIGSPVYFKYVMKSRFFRIK